MLLLAGSTLRCKSFGAVIGNETTVDAPGLSAAKFGTEVLLVLSIFPQLTSTCVTGMIDLHE